MKIDWTKWSAIAEIASSIAVALTLVVLVIGVRENTDTIRATAAAESRDSLSSLDDLILTLDDDILDVFARVTDREANWEDLTSTEQFRVSSLVRAFLRRAEAQFFRYRNGLLDEDVWRTVLARVATNMQSPILLAIWEMIKESTFTPEFVEAVEDAVANGPANLSSLTWHLYEATGC